MTFHEKLDFLMKLTDTKNSGLGRALNYDASYISRIRNGRRGLPRRQPFLEPAAAYFARRVTTPYQKKAASEVICGGAPWPEDPAEAEKLLVVWLKNPRQTGNPVGRLVTGLSRLGGVTPPADKVSPRDDVAQTDGYFCGNAGKRLGVERFLTAVCAMDPVPELLLYSDEEMTWLYEDPAFARRWGDLMTAFLARGGRIRMIHTVDRNLGEMLEAVRKWIPLYASGGIQPYYCPRIRDGICRRTLFLARGRCALTSHSVGDRTEGMVNYLVFNPEVVAALELEFENLLALCRPLMRIYTPKEPGGLFSDLDGLLATPGDWILAQRTPSVFTMPPEVAGEMTRRQKGGNFLRRREKLHRELLRFLRQGGRVTEILCLPDAEQIREGSVHLPLNGLDPSPCYTPAEFAAHLRAAVRLMEEENGYRIILSDAVPETVVFYAKEEGGVLLASERSPYPAFLIQEARMTAACWEYLRQVAREGDPRSTTVRALKNRISKLA